MPIRRVFSDATYSLQNNNDGQASACEPTQVSLPTVSNIKRYRSAENELYSSKDFTLNNTMEILAKTPKAKTLSKEVGMDICSYLQTQIEISRKLNSELARVFAHLEDGEGLRTRTVEFICNVSEDFKLQTTTAHVAVNYLDRILSKAKVATNERIVLSLACIRLAAKFEEPNPLLVPNIDSLIDLVESRYKVSEGKLKPSELARMERFIWSGLDNRLWVLTPAHFLEMFTTLGLLYLPVNGDLLMVETRQSHKSITKDVLDYCGFFVDLALQQISLQGVESALLAGVIISCARRAFGITPVWSQYLQGCTRLLFQGEMEQIHIYLWQIYAKIYRRESVLPDENSLISFSSSDSSSSVPSSFSSAAESPLGPADHHEHESHRKSGFDAQF